VAERREVRVASAIALERGPVAVRRPAVRLDEDAVLGPREVDDVGAHAVVDHRFGEARGADQAEHPALERAAGGSRGVAREVLGAHQSSGERLTGRAVGEAEVLQGPQRRGDGKAAYVLDLCGPG